MMKAVIHNLEIFQEGIGVSSCSQLFPYSGQWFDSNFPQIQPPLTSHKFLMGASWTSSRTVLQLSGPLSPSEVFFNTGTVVAYTDLLSWTFLVPLKTMMNGSASMFAYIEYFPPSVHLISGRTSLAN